MIEWRRVTRGLSLWLLVLMQMMFAGCQQGESASSDPSSAELAIVGSTNALTATESTQETYGIYEWVTTQHEDAAVLEGMDANGKSLAIFEVTRDYSGKNENGYVLIDALGALEVRSRRGEVISSEMSARSTAIFDAMLEDVAGIAKDMTGAQPAATAESETGFVEKQETCGPCGSAGTETFCYGVVLWCYDLNNCGRCANDYICGACIGIGPISIF